jgi:hypothetical protein
MTTPVTPEVDGPNVFDREEPAAQAVCVTDYLDVPFEQICALLERSGGQPFSDEGPTRRNYLLGDLVRVSRSVARVLVGRVGAAENTAELRILPVLTGRGAVTELLLVAPASSMMSRGRRVHEARELLEAVVRHVDAAAAAESESWLQRPAS